MSMFIEARKAACKDYFYGLCEQLKDTHELVASCNRDDSMYLIPKGTIDQLSYTSKPADSYRYSDHWNWYANVKKCPDPDYIQCHNVDVYGPNKRVQEGRASKPRFFVCVAYFDSDNKYHTVFK